MRFRSWLDGLTSTPVRPRAERGSRPKPPGCKLTVEPLEDRSLPSFLGPVGYPVGPSPQALVAADFNGDGAPDLAVANSGSNTVSVLPGNGDGTFQPPRDFAAGPYPSSLAAGDFDADGHPDLVTTGVDGVSVLRGDGRGGFAPPTHIDIDLGPDFQGPGSGVGVTVGDFNGDGLLDLGVTSYDLDQGAFAYGFASVLWGDGRGVFQSPGAVTELGFFELDPVVAADFDGDGRSDLAVAGHAYGNGTVGVLLGGSLGPTWFDTGLATAGALAAGDVDGDGDIDLVAAVSGVSVLLNDGHAAFVAAGTYATGGSTAVALGDFTGDGALDVITANPGTGPDYAGSVSVLRGRGDGTFAPAATFAAGPYAWAVAAGDFNGDGWLDAATANQYGNNVSVLINDQTWPAVDLPLATISDVTVKEGNTGTVNAVFTVRLSAASDRPVTVHYATADGTATAGSDYNAASGDLIFAPGETTKTVTVAVLGDRSPEATESFAVNLTSTDAVVSDGQGVGTIADDEPRIRINDVIRLEGNSGTTRFVFTVSLSAAYDEGVTVNFATADGSATVADHDYQAQSGTLTFAPGETTKTISIVVHGDKKKEPDEWFAVNLSGVSDNALLLDPQGIGWILNDDNHG
jgi:hypothetical protein